MGVGPSQANIGLPQVGEEEEKEGSMAGVTNPLVFDREEYNSGEGG